MSEFLHLLPQNHRAVFEFRNDTWFADDVYAALREAGAALCLSEREDNAPPPMVATAPWGYVRLRLENYSEGDLQEWAGRLAATAWGRSLRVLHARADCAGLCTGVDALRGCGSGKRSEPRCYL